MLYYVYLDNIGIMGLDPSLVNDALDQAEENFNEFGLDAHEKIAAASWSENLGLVMDVDLGRCIPCPRRLSKILHAIIWFLRRSYISLKAARGPHRSLHFYWFVGPVLIELFPHCLQVHSEWV